MDCLSTLVAYLRMHNTSQIIGGHIKPPAHLIHIPPTYILRMRSNSIMERG
jgi:hypothetical protein